MTLIVKKFGGTSVGDVSRIKNVARLIKEYGQKNPGVKLVVVVSAMAGETNKLLALAKSCAPNPNPRELDVLISTGEQVTIALMAMALNEQGLSAKSLDGSQARISTDRQHLNAQIQEIDVDPIQRIIDLGMIPVVAGFQGVDSEGDVTTLGRGGSDITAVALAAALKADACYIYTDVDGVYSTDPRICPKARRIGRICHEEMLELASLGAKVLHPRSVYFAMRYKVPLIVLSSFNPVDGTWIVEEEELMEKPVVTGITYRIDEAKITIARIQGGIKAFDRIFGVLAEQGIFVDMISQTGFVGGVTNLSFTVPDEVSSTALSACQRLVPELKAEGAGCDRDIAKISVVGVGMRYHTGVAAKMFKTLANEGIDVQMIATSEIKVSIVVPRKYCEVAVRALHQTFIEDGAVVGVEQ